MGKRNIKFNLVNKKPINLDEIYPAFKKDFLKPYITIDRLKKKYHIGNGDYNTLRLRVLSETGLKHKPCVRNRRLVDEDDKYLIRHRDGRYSIFKKDDDGYIESYGKYPSFGVAVYVRDKLIETDWDKDIVEELRTKYALN